VFDRDCTKRRRRRRRWWKRRSGEQECGDTLGCFSLENGTDGLFLNVGN
jgi:hypothetical protein